MEALLNRFRRDGTFGNFTEVVGGMDDRFTLRDFWRMFRSIPRLRKDLIYGLAWNLVRLLIPTKRAVEPGHCRHHSPGGKYTFSHRSFCDLVVWEAILGAVGKFELPLTRELRDAVMGSVEMALRNGREIEFEGKRLTVFSYYPSRDHMVPPKHPSYKHFMSWDAGVPDNDSTCIVLGSLLRLLRDLDAPLDILERPAAVMGAHLDLLQAHVHRCGAYGQGFLSYESGVRDVDKGVLTWIFDEHNELDPTSNINILNFLFLLGGNHPELEPAIARLCGGILGFLSAHAASDGLFLPRLQQYYSFPATLFFWHRFLHNLEALDPGLVARLDPGGIIEQVNACMRAEAELVFVAKSSSAHSGDLALASPFLAREGLTGAIRTWKDSAEPLAHFERNHYEIFHLLYPVQVICVTENLPAAAYLLMLSELS